MTSSTSKPMTDAELTAIQDNFVHFMCDVCQFPVYERTGVANLLCGATGSPLTHVTNSTKPECVLCTHIATTGCSQCGTVLTVRLN